MRTKEEFNVIVLREIGLEVNEVGYIVDQDTCKPISFKNKFIKAYNVTRNELEFDPLNNQFLMNGLFAYFLEKLHEEEGKYVNMFYSLDDGKLKRNNSGYIECIVDNQVTLKSEVYFNDSLKFVDLIIKLNQSIVENLHDFE